MANGSERNDVMPCSPAFNMAVEMADLHTPERVKKGQVWINTAIFTQHKLFALLQICKDNFSFHLPFSFNNLILFRGA